MGRGVSGGTKLVGQARRRKDTASSSLTHSPSRRLPRRGPATTPLSPATPAAVRHSSALLLKRKAINHLCNMARSNASESIGSSGRLSRLQGADVSWACFMSATHSIIKRRERACFMSGDAGFGVEDVSWGLGSEDSECVFVTNKMFLTKLID